MEKCYKIHIHSHVYSKQFTTLRANSMSDTYIHKWTKSVLLHIMGWCLCDAKPLTLKRLANAGSMTTHSWWRSQLPDKIMDLNELILIKPLLRLLTQPVDTASSSIQTWLCHYMVGCAFGCTIWHLICCFNCDNFTINPEVWLEHQVVISFYWKTFK